MMRGSQDPCFPFLVNVILFSLLHTRGHLGLRTEVKVQPHWLTEGSVASTGSYAYHRSLMFGYGAPGSVALPLGNAMPTSWEGRENLLRVYGLLGSSQSTDEAKLA